MKLTPSEAYLVVRSLRWINDNSHDTRGTFERLALINKLEPLARRAELATPDRGPRNARLDAGASATA